MTECSLCNRERINLYNSISNYRRYESSRDIQIFITFAWEIMFFGSVGLFDFLFNFTKNVMNRLY